MAGLFLVLYLVSPFAEADGGGLLPITSEAVRKQSAFSAALGGRKMSSMRPTLGDSKLSAGRTTPLLE